ncbi:MAG: hypothetical protein WD826_06895 [Actinomycetota bacterium]
MTTQEQVSAQQAMSGIVSAERLAERFAEVFRTNDPSDVFAPDAFFDLNMPVWRFQIQGVEDFEAWARDFAPDGVEVSVLNTVPTISGFVTEHEVALTQDGERMTARKMWLCEVREGMITEATEYCSGGWDEALRRRHAVEAPMIRP